MKKRSVLILTDRVQPPINAPRMRYLYNNLYKYHPNWKAVLLTDFVDEKQIATLFENPASIHQIGFLPARNILRWLLSFAGNLFFHTIEKKMMRMALQIAKNQSFDVILCSTSNIFPIYAATRVARALHLPLVLDMRDLTEQYAVQEFTLHRLPLMFLQHFFAKIYGKLIIFQRNRLIKQASEITAISPWHVDFLRRFNRPVTLIYNGFDETLFVPQKIISPKFIITYTGRLSESRAAHLQEFFSALTTLNKNGKIALEQIEIHWFIPQEEADTVKKTATANGLLPYNHFLPLVANSEMPHILNRSSLLLLLTSPKYRGVMTTKFFEYLGVEKPVLCVMSDEGCLAQSIAETAAGKSATNETDIADFVSKTFAQWQSQGYTQANVNRAAKQLFSRTAQTKQFIEVMERAIAEQ